MHDIGNCVHAFLALSSSSFASAFEFKDEPLKDGVMPLCTLILVHCADVQPQHHISPLPINRIEHNARSKRWNPVR